MKISPQNKMPMCLIGKMTASKEFIPYPFRGLCVICAACNENAASLCGE